MGGSVSCRDLSLSVAVERSGFLPASAVHRVPFPRASGFLFPGVLAESFRNHSRHSNQMEGHKSLGINYLSIILLSERIGFHQGSLSLTLAWKLPSTQPSPLAELASHGALWDPETLSFLVIAGLLSLRAEFCSHQLRPILKVPDLRKCLGANSWEDCPHPRGPELVTTSKRFTLSHTPCQASLPPESHFPRISPLLLEASFSLFGHF